MKRKLLRIVLSAVCLFGITGKVNATVSSNAKDSVGNYTITRDLGGGNKFQTGLYTEATFGSVKAYCIDPGSKAVNNGVDCPASVVKDDDFANAAAYIFSSKESTEIKAAALRMVALVTGKGSVSGFGNTDDNHRINARCGYINAAFQVAEKSGYGTSSMSGLKGYKSASNTGNLTCYNKFDVTLNSKAMTLATEALKKSKSEPAATGEKPTAKVTTNNGKATLLIDNSKGVSDVKVTINCDANTTGDCGEKTVAKNSKATFILTSKVNDSTQCGTFTASMTYENASATPTGCTEVTIYSCAKTVSSFQDYVGCSKIGDSGKADDGKTPKDGTGTQVTETIKDPNGGGETIHIKCDEKKKVCPYNDSQVEVAGDGNGLCDADGKEVIKVGEAALYTQDVEDCIIDNEKFLVASSDNGVCKTYCVEDYSFESDGLMLSGEDKDPTTGTVTITAGSYFNFANPNPKATEKGTVKCYTKLDLQTFAANVEKTAQKTYADHMTTEKHSCSCTTDENSVTTCSDVVTTTTYTAHYANNKVTFTPNTNVVTNPVSSCTGLKDIESTADSYRETYTGQVNSLINELRSCTDTATDGEYYSEECNSKVVFDYGFNMDPVVIPAENKKTDVEVNYKSNCNGDYSKCSATQKDTIPEANLDLGVGSSIKYPALEYVEKVATITAEYNLKGMGICNDYNKGTSNYPVDEATCKSSEGTTWVEGWPIKYDTPQDGYKYEITVTNFGHVKALDKCKTLDHYLSGNVLISCEYTVNGCTNCDFDCEPGDSCEIETCDSDCIAECAGVGCIYDVGNGLAVNYQPISMLSVDDAFAYLSNRYANVTAVAHARNTALRATQLSITGTHRNIASINWGTEKGQATLDLVEDRGETIYAGEPEYKVTLTPAKLNEIKNNNSTISDGFLNQSLECKVTDESLEYVTCTSKFLNELRADGLLEGTAKNEPTFENIDKISEYVSGYNINSARKSGTGPAWK